VENESSFDDIVDIKEAPRYSCSLAGAYASTASDLATWANALYSGAILDPATLSAMADTSPSLPYKPKYPYGMGFEQTTLAGQVAWGHRGQLDGFWSAMWYLPASHVTDSLTASAARSQHGYFIFCSLHRAASPPRARRGVRGRWFVSVMQRRGARCHFINVYCGNLKWMYLYRE